MSIMKGKVAIITGATRGIGRAAAITLAREGASVIAAGRDEKAGHETEALVRKAGGTCIFIRADVTKPEDWQRLTSEAKSKFGGLDCVVNNAGVFWVKPIDQTTDEELDQITAVNIEGAWLGTKFGFQAIAETGRGGTIVNVSSLMGQVGYPGAVAYCGTKGAVTGLTKAAALEGAGNAPKIRVNSLHPGIIWTEMITGSLGDAEELKNAFAADTPLRAVGLPEQMADAILYLASDQSSYVTGAELTVDGGRGAD